MAFRRLFPQGGGGPLRRWYQVRKEIIERHYLYRDTGETLKDDSMLKGPITLFDFGRKNDAIDANLADHGPAKGGWRLSDDGVIGGYSCGNLKLIQSNTINNSLKPENNIHVNDEDSSHDSNISFRNTNNNSEKVESNTDNKIMTMPFIKWKGNIDTRIGSKSRARRSGFCAIRSPEFPFGGAPIGHRYNALEIMCRSDGRVYTVNLNVASYFPDDLYQGLITIDKTEEEFVTLVLPFRDFILTSGGLIREQQRALDGYIQLESIGLTLMDGDDGEFEFDVSRVRAINYIDGKVLGEDDENITTVSNKK